MLDLKLVRDDPEGVKAALAKRGPGVADQVDRLLEADAARRRLGAQGDTLRGAPKPRQRLRAGLKELPGRLDEAEARLRAAEAALAEIQARMPNLPDPVTPAGGEEAPVELRRAGPPQ